MMMVFAQFLALIFRQILILAPAFMQFRTFLRWHISEMPISLTGLLALFWRKLRPLAHTCLQALLTFGRHVGIALGNI